jgi:uncharacterized RmlC-like cupin family protein
MADEHKPGVIAVRTGVGIDARQKIPYFVGISQATVGAQGLLLQRMGHSARGAAMLHVHQGYETVIYVLSGQVETTYGPELRSSVVIGPSEFFVHRT